MGQWYPYCRHKRYLLMIQILLTFLVFAFSACGLGKLYLILIRHGQLLSFMQRPLRYLQDRKDPASIFAYKSIGGCDICTVQRFADVAFFFLVYTNQGTFHSNTILNILAWFFLYCLFGGMVFYATSLITKDPPQPKKTTETIQL